MVFGKTINKFYLKYIHLFLIGIFFIILVDWVQLEIPEFIRDVIDGLNEQTLDREGLIQIAKSIGLYAGIIIIGRFFWRITLLKASRMVVFELQNKLFAHLENLDMSFYNRSKIGGLMALFTNDMNAIRMSVGFGAVMIVDTLFLGTLAFYKMYSINVFMSFLSTIPLVLLAIIGGLLAKMIKERFHDRQKAFEDMSDFVNENMSGIHVVKAFVKEPIEKIQFLLHNKDNKEKTLKYVKLVALVEVFTRVIVFTIVVIILWYGGYLLKTTASTNNPFTYGMLFEYIQYFLSMIWPMIAAVRVIQIGSSAKASLERINNVLDEEVVVKDGGVTSKPIHGAITFEHVTFRYPDSSMDQLKDISVSIKQGETIGIVGKTGSGKTTFVDLLLRIYNIEQGTLLLDGNDIMHLPIHEVREAIGYVPQDGFLFSDTIRYNISLGIEEETLEEVMNYAKLAAVHENIIEFHKGYDTEIGERGVTLSGGQKQRISIARALIKDPAILILDDSVSAVDTETEKAILSNLKSLRQDKTTLIIAHRISSIEQADRIILLDDGVISGIGTHEELLLSNELYKDMVERQLLEDELEVY